MSLKVAKGTKREYDNRFRHLDPGTCLPRNFLTFLEIPDNRFKSMSLRSRRQG